jgi:hypothetical protein
LHLLGLGAEEGSRQLLRISNQHHLETREEEAIRTDSVQGLQQSTGGGNHEDGLSPRTATDHWRRKP